MLCRYKKARAKGREFFQAAVEEDQELLAEFGMILLSVDSGLRIAVKKSLRGKKINPWDAIEMSSRIWGWLRPLLVELAEYRKLKATASAEGSEGSALYENGVNGHHVNGRLR